jgi:hypothetical protein
MSQKKGAKGPSERDPIGRKKHEASGLLKSVQRTCGGRLMKGGHV